MLLIRRTASALITALLLLLALAAVPAQASGEEPAGGAAIGEIVIATAGAMTLTGLLLGLGWAHRTGRTQLLARAAAASERRWGIPGWAALPSVVSALSLIVALLGMYWDISLHIDDGRDAGPLANPAHYLILAGLFGVFISGFLAIVLPSGRTGPSAVRISRDWHAPLGGVMLLACGAFSLAGFPLDDMWHRLFGQDVTLWGPTHLMLIGGAALTLIGRAVLMVEGVRARRATAGSEPVAQPRLLRLQHALLAGGFLIGLSTFQAEFDFGVAQFRFLFQPVLIALAGATALVTVRIWAGRGSAFLAVGLFLALRGFVAFTVGPVLGETTPHFPLYLAEAALVELVALRVSTDRPLAFGAVCGAVIGTVGLAVEWGWSHVWMPLPWPSALLPEAALLGLAAALAGGLIGGFIGAALSADERPLHRPRVRPAIPAVATLVVAAIVGYGLVTAPEAGVTARVSLADARSGPDRAVDATVTVDPPSAARDAEWLTATAWQGGGFVVDRLERVRDGVYRTTTPIPVNSDWKAMIRLHRGRSLLALPVYLPEDRAIPAAGVPADATFTRPFASDKKILQREAKDAAPWLALVGYSVVLAIALAVIALLGWGLSRMAATAHGARRSGERPPAPTAGAPRSARPPAPARA